MDQHDPERARKLVEQYGEPRQLLAADAVTKYLARRLIERERALADLGMTLGDPRREALIERRLRRLRALAAFLFGVFVGLAALVIAAMLTAPR